MTDGGQTYGDATLSEWFLGSGGGGGSPDAESDGQSSSNYAGAGGAGVRERAARGDRTAQVQVGGAFITGLPL